MLFHGPILTGGRCGACRRIVSLLLSGLVLASTPPSLVTAQTVPAEQAAIGGRYATPIAEAAQRFRIPALWVAAVLDAESAGDPRAVSSAGAMGLMQVMPDTWAELRARHGLGRDPFDVGDNIMAGAAYLRAMWDRYGTIGGMLAAYNAGPGRYDEHVASGRPLPAETRAYVAALAPILAGETAPKDAALAPPVPADWRDAPLFVVRLDGASPALAPQTVGAPEADAPAPDSDDNSLDPGSNGGLFAPRSGNGDRP